ncbi:hypothetical protein SGCOL_001924 [Colletotrichum sp. CLE4]
MTTLDPLKNVLRQQAAAHGSTATQSLSDAQYSAGSSFFEAGPACKTSQDFILPQLYDKVAKFDHDIASQLSRHSSADAFLYWDTGNLHLGVTMYEASTAGKVAETPSLISTPMATILGPEYSTSIVDSVGLFENEMFMSAMHGGYAGGKTSAFKRVADPRHIIAYACSLPREPMEHGLIIVVTGDSCAGKGHCAKI